MNTREQKRRMRAERRELTRRMADARKQARAQVAQLPSVRRQARRRRVRRVLAVVALLILALFLRCPCAPGEPQVVEAPPPEVLKKPAPKPVKPKLPPLMGDLSKQRRGAYEGDPAALHPWLDTFRIQVAARSPRLAECFKGADKPGALRWTSSVNPRDGSVSDHVVEALAQSIELRDEQHQCLLQVLSEPHYRLQDAPNSDDAQSTPARISLVIEF